MLWNGKRFHEERPKTILNNGFTSTVESCSTEEMGRASQIVVITQAGRGNKYWIIIRTVISPVRLVRFESRENNTGKRVELQSSCTPQQPKCHHSVNIQHSTPFPFPLTSSSLHMARILPEMSFTS